LRVSNCISARERQRGAGTEARQHARDANLPEDLGGRQPQPGRPAADADRHRGNGERKRMTSVRGHRHRAKVQKPSAVVANAEPALPAERRIVAHRSRTAVEGVQQAGLETPSRRNA
jgi:hypothetical protein